MNSRWEVFAGYFASIVVVLWTLIMLAKCQDILTPTNLTLAAAIAADGATTQIALSRGATERNPLARPLAVRGAAGQAALSGIQLAATVVLARVLERHGHPKAARYVRVLTTAAEAGAAANNLAWVRGHRR